jgi:glycosyltransferase involved in cell wall biosynthesis
VPSTAGFCLTGRPEPRITVVIPVYNDAGNLAECLHRLAASTVPYECIVVDDASHDDSASVAQQAGVKLLFTGKRSGPGHARNLGAAQATTDLLLFLDADVCVYPDNLERVVTAFDQDPELDALIGSYDSQPKKPDFLSQYRNLMHHFVHQNSRSAACTFWSGFGAIRKGVFAEHKGFDARFSKPSIEDIELGYRLRMSNRKIVLDATLQVTHLKEWSLIGVIRTDVTQRAIPWTELILQSSSMPNDLNVSISQRISVALVFILIGLGLISSALNARLLLAPLLALAFLLLSQYEVEITSGWRSKRVFGTALLIALLSAASFWGHQPWILVCSLLAFLLLLFRRHYYDNGFRRRKVIARVCVLYFAAALIFVTTTLRGSPLAIAFFALLGTVTLLNARFFILLASKRGKLHAAAAVPFLMLFYLNCGVGFIVGLMRFVCLHKLRSRNSPISTVRMFAKSLWLVKPLREKNTP